MTEGLPRDIGHGEVGEGEFGDPESGRAPGFFSGTDALTKEGQLKANVPTFRIGEISRGIPPLGLELAMGAMVPGKLILPAGFRRTPSLTLSQEKTWKEKC